LSARWARIAFNIEIVFSPERRFVEKPFQALQHLPLLARVGCTRPAAASVRPFAYLYSSGLGHDAHLSRH
jgi:hypothetical protein